MPKQIDPAKIVIKENRQRQEFDPEKMQDLIASIEKNGLLHPVVLRAEPGTGMVLVAGERRLKAMREIFELGGSFVHDMVLYSEMIPYSDLGELDVLEAEEAELDENLKRVDLTWQEHAAAVKRLHELRRAQKAEEAVVDSLLNGEGLAVSVRGDNHTVADTAREILGKSDGVHQDSIRQEIIVARHLDDPAIANAKSAKEAFKILKAKEERVKNQELAAAVGKTFSAVDHRLIHGNCLEIMAEMLDRYQEDEKFDVLVCDPPYGMGADQFGDGGGKMTAIEHHYDDSPEHWVELMKEWCPLSFKITKEKAHAYVFCDIDKFHPLKHHMEKAGWYVFRTPLTVLKRNSGRVPLPDMGPRRQTEWVLYAIKGKKPVTHIYPDIVESSADEQLGHGAQKPVAVYQNLLQRSVQPGDKVADFFAGTGPIIPAAHALKCFATAVEMDAANFARCVRRVKDIEAIEAGNELNLGN